jgi:diguanylate cyclase
VTMIDRSDIEQELQYTRQAFARAVALLQKYDIPPIPENYAVWYHYATGTNTALMQEVDNIINNGLTFTQETCSYLHNKFILANSTQKIVDDSAVSAQNIMTEVLKAINEFGSETQTFSNSIDEYLENISQKFEDIGVQNIVMGLISATAGLKQHAEKIGKKLEESTAEINLLNKNLQQVTLESQRDFLTGVFNRKTFERYVDEQMLICREKNAPLCLLMIDIDHFKSFNDQFGHLLGDEVLKTVARTLTEILKGRDIVARFGGEEFIVILPETPIEGAMKVAEMIRNAIAGKELKRKDSRETYGTITVSIGVSLFRPQSDTLPTLIKRADDALYISKHSGRNRVTREGT